MFSRVLGPAPLQRRLSSGLQSGNRLYGSGRGCLSPRSRTLRPCGQTPNMCVWFCSGLEGRAPSRFRHILWTLLAPCVWIYTGTVHVIYRTLRNGSVKTSRTIPWLRCWAPECFMCRCFGGGRTIRLRWSCTSQCLSSRSYMLMTNLQTYLAAVGENVVTQIEINWNPS